DGHGGFRAGTATYGIAGYEIADFFVADMDGDHRPDVVLRERRHNYLRSRYRIRYQRGGADFIVAVPAPSDPRTDDPDTIYGMAIGDVTADGRADAVVFSTYGGVINSLWTSPNVGGGQLGPGVRARPWFADANYQDSTPLTVSDVDGDGHGDLAIFD